MTQYGVARVGMREMGTEARGPARNGRRPLGGLAENTAGSIFYVLSLGLKLRKWRNFVGEILYKAQPEQGLDKENYL